MDALLDEVLLEIIQRVKSARDLMAWRCVSKRVHEHLKGMPSRVHLGRLHGLCYSKFVLYAGCHLPEEWDMRIRSNWKHG